MVGKVHLSRSGGTPYSFFQGCLLQKTKESLRNNPNSQLTEDFTTISLKLGSGMCTLLGKWFLTLPMDRRMTLCYRVLADLSLCKIGVKRPLHVNFVALPCIFSISH